MELSFTTRSCSHRSNAVTSDAIFSPVFLHSGLAYRAGWSLLASPICWVLGPHESPGQLRQLALLRCAQSWPPAPSNNHIAVARFNAPTRGIGEDLKVGLTTSKGRPLRKRPVILIECYFKNVLDLTQNPDISL